MTACGIERSAQVVGALRCPVIGMTQQRLGDADMFRVVNRQLGGHDLAKQMRVQVTTELALGSATDDLPDLLRAQPLTGDAEPLSQRALAATGGVKRATRTGR